MNTSEVFIAGKCFASWLMYDEIEKVVSITEWPVYENYFNLGILHISAMSSAKKCIVLELTTNMHFLL